MLRLGSQLTRCQKVSWQRREGCQWHFQIPDPHVLPSSGGRNTEPVVCGEAGREERGLPGIAKWGWRGDCNLLILFLLPEKLWVNNLTSLLH